MLLPASLSVEQGVDVIIAEVCTDCCSFFTSKLGLGLFHQRIFKNKSWTFLSSESVHDLAICGNLFQCRTHAVELILIRAMCILSGQWQKMAEWVREETDH